MGNKGKEIDLQKTTVPSLILDRDRRWFFLNLEGKTIGRIAPKIVAILRGKNSRNFIPNSDGGDYVVLVNAGKGRITGNLDSKKYYNYSGYPGGLRERTTRTMLEEYPVELVERIIKGMMPHTKLGEEQLKRLFIYRFFEHRHQAQEKKFINIEL